MSKVLSLDFEHDHDYSLIGIHSSLADYRMAFFLNKELNSNFRRHENDLDFESKNCKYSLYEYKDEKAMISWSLLANKYINYLDVTNDESNLFQNESKISYLIPEKRRVDFFIKIDGTTDDSIIDETINKIKNIKKVITLYTIDPYELRSRDFLIF